MSVHNDIFQAVKAAATLKQTGYTKIEVGTLPLTAGLSMYMGGGAPYERFLDRGGNYDMTIALNGKDSNLSKLIDALSDIHTGLSRETAYPSGTNWQIISIDTQGSPSEIGQEETGGAARQWVYGSSLNIRFYIKGSD